MCVLLGVRHGALHDTQNVLFLGRKAYELFI